MFGLGRTRAIEKEMADWLAHPAEFGVPPKTVRLKRTYRGEVISTGAVEIHLVEYEMPDGTTGRGFVNGPFSLGPSSAGRLESLRSGLLPTRSGNASAKIHKAGADRTSKHGGYRPT